MTVHDLLVIGAGMAGLRAAGLRAAAGDDVLVLDKGRRHGGRLATRRVDDVAFDTGAASFAAHGDAFRAAVRDWASMGHVVPDTDRPERWRGQPTMRALPTALAERSGVAVRLATTVVAIGVVDGVWRVDLQNGGARDDGGARDRVSGRTLVLTAPAPQSATLLRSGDGLAAPETLALLDAVTYAPSLAVLVRPVDPACGVLPHTLQGDAAFSAAHLDGDREAAARHLAARASEELGCPLEVVHVHGWRYAQVRTGIPLPALRDDSSGAPLILAGDLFEGDGAPAARAEGVERAFLSGTAAAGLAGTPGPTTTEEDAR